MPHYCSFCTVSVSVQAFDKSLRSFELSHFSSCPMPCFMAQSSPSPLRRCVWLRLSSASRILPMFDDDLLRPLGSRRLAWKNETTFLGFPQFLVLFATLCRHSSAVGSQSVISLLLLSSSLTSYTAHLTSFFAINYVYAYLRCSRQIASTLPTVVTRPSPSQHP